MLEKYDEILNILDFRGVRFEFGLRSSDRGKRFPKEKFDNVARSDSIKHTEYGCCVPMFHSVLISEYPFVYYDLRLEYFVAYLSWMVYNVAW